MALSYTNKNVNKACTETKMTLQQRNLNKHLVTDATILPQLDQTNFVTA
jgi:hypothetical protein